MAQLPDAALEGTQEPAHQSNGKPSTKKKRLGKKKAAKSSGASKSGSAPKKAAVVKIASDELPRRTLKDSLSVPRVLHDTYAGKSATWNEIASVLGVAASNANNRYPLWAAEAYGLIRKDETTGSYSHYSLTTNGRRIIAPSYPGEENEAAIQAINTPAILGRFYADYNGSPVPYDEYLLNLLETRYGIPRERRREAADIIIDNARDWGILAEDNGKRSIVLSGLPASSQPAIPESSQPARIDDVGISAEGQIVDYSKVCFFITPIGKDDSEQRKHSDMILKHLINPVLKDKGLEVVRADKIGKPGLITQQIVEHLARSRLCIADLSFHNPSAFYEIGVRHTFRLPTIQIIRKIDTIPFDVAQARTITIDTSDVYTIMDRFASAREELKEHVEHSLNAPKSDSRDNPISYYLPGLKTTIPQQQAQA